MDSDFADSQLSSVAGAIADPARARMLCLLLDGRARTATGRGRRDRRVHGQQPFPAPARPGLVEQAAQGKHRYYRLANGEVARALEALLVVAGAERTPFKPSTPSALREARTCYDHMAGTLAVRMHDAMLTRQWLAADGKDYALTRWAKPRSRRSAWTRLRRAAAVAASPALPDWSERRPHLGGALGAALLDALTERGWVSRDLIHARCASRARASASFRRSSAMPARRPSRARIGTSRPVRPRLSALSRLRHSGRGCAFMDADWPRP